MPFKSIWNIIIHWLKTRSIPIELVMEPRKSISWGPDSNTRQVGLPQCQMWYYGQMYMYKRNKSDSYILGNIYCKTKFGVFTQTLQQTLKTNSTSNCKNIIPTKLLYRIYQSIYHPTLLSCCHKIATLERNLHHQIYWKALETTSNKAPRLRQICEVILASRQIPTWQVMGGRGLWTSGSFLRWFIQSTKDVEHLF